MYNLNLPMLTWAGYQQGPRQTFPRGQNALAITASFLMGAALVVTVLATA